MTSDWCNQNQSLALEMEYGQNVIKLSSNNHKLSAASETIVYSRSLFVNSDFHCWSKISLGLQAN